MFFNACYKPMDLCVPVTEDTSEFRTPLSNQETMQATNVHHGCNLHCSSSHIFKSKRKQVKLTSMSKILSLPHIINIERNMCIYSLFFILSLEIQTLYYSSFQFRPASSQVSEVTRDWWPAYRTARGLCIQWPRGQRALKNS